MAVRRYSASSRKRSTAPQPAPYAFEKPGPFVHTLSGVVRATAFLRAADIPGRETAFASLCMAGQAKGNHRLGITVARLAMMHGNRPRSTFQRRAARYSTAVAVAGQHLLPYSPSSLHLAVSACNRSHKGPRREPYRSRRDSRSTAGQRAPSATPPTSRAGPPSPRPPSSHVPESRHHHRLGR